MTFQTLPITNKAIASNIATLTSSDPIYFQQYDWVKVKDVGDPFNGVFQITATTTNTFSYALTAPDLASQPALGNVRQATDLEEALQRLCYIEQELTPGAVAVAAAFYHQEQFPFWTNRAEEFPVAHDDFDQIYIVNYKVVARQVVASFEEDYRQDAETGLWIQIPQTIDYLEKRQFLQSNAAPTSMPYLDPLGMTVDGGKTLYGQLNTGIGANQFGFELAMVIPIKRDREQAFA